LESLIKVGAMSKFGKRASLLASVDELKGRFNKKKDSNQRDLFEDDSSLKADISSSQSLIYDVPELTDEELELLEKQLLGFSLSAKPITELIGKLAKDCSHKISDLEDVLEEELVTVAVVVREIRTILTKRNAQEMAFIKAEDDTGYVELVVFPRIYTETKNIWNENGVVLVTGKVDKREDSIALIVDHIGQRGNSGSASGQFIKIPKSVDIEKLKELKELLTKNKGDRQVTIYFEETNKRINLPFGVEWSEELAKRVRKVLG